MRKIFTLIFLSMYCVCAICQTTSIKGLVTDNQDNSVIAFANIALYVASDTTRIIKGTATDLQGVYTFNEIAEGDYKLCVSFIGYSTAYLHFSMEARKNKELVLNVSLKKSAVNLDEVVVKGSRAVHNIDRTAYSFSEAEIKKAREGRDLLLNIPNLHIDGANNSLSAVNGKSVLILINGIQSTDTDLKLLPANKIKSVEYYDVPPVRYMDNAEIVVNVITKKLDTGWNGDFYALGGQMYSNGTAALSRSTGNSKFTFGYNIHVNNKRSVNNLEDGLYRYSLRDNLYNYNYNQRKKDWGNQNGVNFSYLNAKENDYAFQVKATTSFNVANMRSTKTINLMKGDNEELRNGDLKDKVKSFSPSLDVYFSKNLTVNSTLTMDVVGTFFNNKQRTHSFESGENGFDDNMKLDIKKKSIIGELVYSQRISNSNLTIGYRGNYNFLSNTLINSLGENPTKNKINTQVHYFYGELSGRIKAFMYRANISGNYNVKLGNMGFRNLTFTPQFLLGYNINQRNSIRLNFRSSTTMPNIQQMSDNKILVMDHFYKTGNKSLENSVTNYLGIMYNYNNKMINIMTTFFYENRKNSLFDNFINKDDYIEVTTDNSYKDYSRGMELSITLTPFNFIRIGGNVSFIQQTFQPTKTLRKYERWTFPTTLYVGVNYKKCSLTYYQRFGGKNIEGLYRCGIEKASYINFAYTYKRAQIGVQCLFPFVDDRFANETLPVAAVYHKTISHLKTKDRAFAVFFSWNFSSGKQKKAYKNIQNSDNDNGVFNVQ